MSPGIPYVIFRADYRKINSGADAPPDSIRMMQGQQMKYFSILKIVSE
jgi:hypothetical protein